MFQPHTKPILIVIFMFLVAIGSQTSTSADTAIITPTAAQKAVKTIGNEPVAVQGIFTMVTGMMALAQDASTYEQIGICCGYQGYDGKLLLIQRGSEFWNFRERYEGATVIARGRLRPEFCAPNNGEHLCHPDAISLIPETIEIVKSAQPGTPRPKLRDLPELGDQMPDRATLQILAARILRHIDSDDRVGLMRLFSPDLYAGFAPDTFKNEYGEANVATRSQIQDIYTRLMSDPNGRARWLFFSAEAGPARGGALGSRYRLFTEHYPAHNQIDQAVVCFIRKRVGAVSWPTAIVSIQTAKTTDPYICYYLRKDEGSWWIDFERTYLMWGRAEPVS
jgi:hypothetical protein